MIINYRNCFGKRNFFEDFGTYTDISEYLEDALYGDTYFKMKNIIIKIDTNVYLLKENNIELDNAEEIIGMIRVLPEEKICIPNDKMRLDIDGKTHSLLLTIK